MSIWKDFIPILLILLLLTACGTDQAKTQDTEQPQIDGATTSPAAASDHPETSTPTATAGNPGTTSPAAEGDVGDDTPLEWPADLMGDIPSASGGIITSIDRGDSFYGEGGPEYITVVSLRGMDLSECQAYIANLQALGFLYDVTEQATDSEIIYSGSLETGEEGVTFKYDFEYDIGFIAYNPLLNSDSSESVSDY